MVKNGSAQLTAYCLRLMESFCNLWIQLDEQILLFRHCMVAGVADVVHPIGEWFLNDCESDVQNKLSR